MTTRSEINSRLQTLSTRNEELETELQQAEETCQQYEARNKAQHELIQNLMETIHSLVVSPSDDEETSSADHRNTTIPEKMCRLLAKNAHRVSHLVEEVERMKFLLKKQMEVTSGFQNSYSDDSDESEHDEDDVEFVDVSLSDNANDYVSATSISLSFSSSVTPASGQQIIRLEEEIVRISSKCTSLERSLNTLKRKNAEREVRSMKSLRNMRQQVENLEQERRRRLDLQTNAEERALQLETELHELRQENNRQNIVRRQQQPTQEQLESLEKGNMGETTPIESGESVKRGIDSCRELIMLRNQLDQDSFPPLLRTVSEDSEESEDDFRPYVEISRP